MLPALGTLPREQQNAVNVYLKNKNTFQSLLSSSTQVRAEANFLKTGFVAASYQPFEKVNLPRTHDWHWTQSNSKTVVKLEDIQITFRKLNPRRRMKSSKPPSYKVWLFHIQTIDNSEHDRYFLWCEKGVTITETEGISTAIGFIYPQNLCIRDFAFLSQYVEEDIALELGWITDKIFIDQSTALQRCL